jgi:predicted kinase
MKEPFVIFMCGLPLAGKSTFCENYLTDVEYIFGSTDDYIEKQCKRQGITYNEGFHTYIEEACTNLVQQLILSVRYNKNIVIDQTNLSPKTRKKKLKYIPEYYHKVAIHLPITLEESISRNTRPGKIIPEDVLKSMAQSIKLPKTEEGFDEVFIGVDSFLSVYPDGLTTETTVY